MTDKTVGTIWLATALLVVILIAGFAITGSGVSKSELNAVLDTKLASFEAPNVPSAEEIASLIQVPSVPEVQIPEFKSDDKVSDLWNDLYSAEIDELELEAENAATLELEDEDYELLVDFLEANIEGFDELKDVDYDEIEVSVIELGLEDDENKVAEVVFELEIEYTLQEGVVQDYKKDVLCTANVVFEEGDFDEEKIDLVFTL